ncbi:MAG: TetR/AcrR family transcriptional regulator [Pararhodobacter sp.]|nr:TetR/AcrR family transcriptional regulator [Pararhodobacter sp.]
MSTAQGPVAQNNPPPDFNALPMGERYCASLAAQAEGAGGEAKSARTRARIKLAAFGLLKEGSDLSQFTIASVTRAAGVATGTFYLHFTSTRELLIEIVSEFIELDITPVLPRRTDAGPLFVRMCEKFREAVRSFRDLRHFYAAVFELKRRDDEVNRVWMAITIRWGRELAQIATRHAAVQFSPACMEMLGQSASGAADDLLGLIYIDEVFGAEFAENPENDRHVAELLALIRHRVLFGRDPDPALLSDWVRAEGHLAVAPQTEPT